MNGIETNKKPATAFAEPLALAQSTPATRQAHVIAKFKSEIYGLTKKNAKRAWLNSELLN